MKKTILAASLALVSLSTLAADYYVVVPVKGRTATQPQSQPTIAVTLNSYTLPSGWVGFPYSGFDLKTVFTVTGDASYSSSSVQWTVVSGALPAGLVLNANGTITGTPTEAVSRDVTVRATYKTASGEQTYSLVTVNLTVALANATIPNAQVGSAFSYDVKSLASSNDPAYTAAQATFTASNLPAWLTFSNGVLSGTPTAESTDQFDLNVTYKTKTATKTYSVSAYSPNDPYWANVTTLLNFEGTAGATSYTEPVKGLTLTFSGSAALSSLKKFGNTSLSVMSGYVGLPGSTFAFGTRPFTLEMFIRRNPTAGVFTLLDTRPTSTNGSYITWGIGSTGGIAYYVNTADRITATAGAVPGDGNFHHIAYSRDNSGIGRIFVDGVQVGNNYADATNYQAASTVYIGKNAFGTAQTGGNMDALRVTDGVARYTSNFTAPVYPYATH